MTVRIGLLNPRIIGTLADRLDNTRWLNLGLGAFRLKQSCIRKHE